MTRKLVGIHKVTGQKVYYVGGPTTMISYYATEDGKMTTAARTLSLSDIEFEKEPEDTVKKLPPQVQVVGKQLSGSMHQAGNIGNREDM